MPSHINQQGQCFEFDLIVIGAGIAGLSYVLEACQLYPEARIALLVKDGLCASNTFYAQGGIAAAAPDSQSIESHINDTLAAGGLLCDQSVVIDIIKAGPETLDYLVRQGVSFNKQANGELARSREGGHTEKRIYYSGDQTGAAIVQTLTEKIAAYPKISVFEQHIAINLITQIKHHTPGAQPEVIGVYVLDEKRELIHTFLARCLVLATGGAGKVYRYTTNPDTATGDGIAMAYRAGARVGDLEFYQFHPTLLYHSKNNNLLISEALRGEGAYLRLPATGERFMERYAPKEMELATRDIIARAIFTEIEHSEFDYVHLDIRHKNAEFLAQRFPYIYQSLLKLGLDLSRDLIPVVPAAHYLCGGILADISGQTDLKRLFAIGETAFTGLHGGNRLASNSLLEGVVMGRKAAQASRYWLTQPVRFNRPIQPWSSESALDKRRASQINAHWRGLRGEMTSYAGIVRTKAGLEDLLKLLTTRQQMIEDYYWKHAITRDLIELRNIILIAELIVRSALTRSDNQGSHFREDANPSDHNAFNTLLSIRQFDPLESTEYS